MTEETKCIIHAGSPKTGTSVVQSLLAANVGLLRELGVYYPEITPLGKAALGEITSGNGEFIARSLLSQSDPYAITRDRAAVEWDLLHAAFADCRGGCVLLSSEYFFAIPVENLRTLKEEISRHVTDIQIIVYLRPQLDYIYSFYAQLVKVGATQAEFDEFADYVIETGEMADYLKIVEDFASVFGDKNLLIRPYEKQQLLGGDICMDFLHALGLGNEGRFKLPWKTVNPTPSLEELKYIRAVHKAGADHAFGAFFVEAVRAVRPLAAFQGSPAPAPIAEKIMRRFDADNNRIARKYLDRNELFHTSVERAQPAMEIQPETLAQMAFAMIATLHGKVLEFEDRLALLERQARDESALRPREN